MIATSEGYKKFKLVGRSNIVAIFTSWCTKSIFNRICSDYAILI
jgi:hypothetical protein